jgi:hypothetical protein
VQVTEHTPAGQLAIPVPIVGPGQLVLQAAPQLFGSVFNGHAPEHRCAPALQLKPHVVPLVHVAVEFKGPAEQAPHAGPIPQLFASLSAAHVAPTPDPQTWKPALHVKLHVVPPVHIGTEFAGAGHAPHAAPSMQLFVSLSAAQVAAEPVPHRW